MTILRFILAGYAFLAVFVSGGLFFRKKEQTYLMISLFTLLFGIEILDFLYSTSVVMEQYPFFYARYYFGVGFIYGPILLFHFKALIVNKTFNKKNLWHFLPFVLATIYSIDFLVLPGIERMLFVSQHFSDRIMPLNIARASHILGYGIYFVVLIYSNYKKLSPQKRLYAVSFCGIYFTTAVLISWLTAFADGWRQFIYAYLIASSIFFLVGFILYKDPEFLQGITKKYLSSNLSRSDMKRIKQKLRQAFKKDQHYLDGKLSVRKLGDLINESPHNISQTLTLELNENFNNYVNSFRIQHAQMLLQDTNYDHYTIEGIALESGFNNKVTFNRAFKEITHQTPSAFRKNPF
ncbi:MAG: helix-turn-helix transcriptional regulator [Balneolaceae bacterium]|nr:helix-turn-helix transcriptional regulator [Balneolaceae bacterium]